jgi:hypothetical protein
MRVGGSGRWHIQILTHGMELSWLGAWAVFAAAALVNRPFPLIEATAAFLGASLLTRLLSGRGWLVIAVLALQAAGLVAATAAMVHAFCYPASPLLDREWLLELFRSERTGADWALVLLGVGSALVFWREGFRLARRPLDEETLSSRFDVGLAAFFLLFLVELVAAYKGARLDDPASHLFLLPFFVTSLLALGLNRLPGDGQKEFLPGFRGAGVFLTFIAAALLPAGALVLFALPYLRLAAQGGLYVLAHVGSAVSPYLIAVLRFLFAPRPGRPGPVAPTPERPLPGLPAQAPDGWFTQWLATLFAWAAATVLTVAAIAAVGVLLYLLVRFLFSRTAAAPVQPRRGPVWPRLARLRELLAGFLRRLRPARRAPEVYGRLLGWGRRSGVRPLRTETPSEFGAKLQRSFPQLAGEIGLIVQAFNVEVYGGKQGGAAPAARAAWRRVRSPRHWPARLHRLWGA